jgi:membrane protease YdiL (CAAX protease family)
VVGLLAAWFVGACGEELGRRCLLQPTLRLRAGPATTGVAVGLLRGAWHVPVLALGPFVVVGFLAGTVGMSVMPAVLLDAAGMPVLIGAGAFHLLVNVGLLVLGDERSATPAPSSPSAEPPSSSRCSPSSSPPGAQACRGRRDRSVCPTGAVGVVTGSW